VSIDVEGIETNIVVFEVTDPSRSSSEILGTLKQAGLLINSLGGMSFRAVTHLNVSAQAIEEAGRIFTRVLIR
jgi:threonine aldolase